MWVQWTVVRQWMWVHNQAWLHQSAMVHRQLMHCQAALLGHNHTTRECSQRAPLAQQQTTITTDNRTLHHNGRKTTDRLSAFTPLSARRCYPHHSPEAQATPTGRCVIGCAHLPYSVVAVHKMVATSLIARSNGVKNFPWLPWHWKATDCFTKFHRNLE